jgi:putative membrane protein
MLSPAQAALLSWSIPPAATFALVLTALIYLRGWMLMCRARVPFVPAWRAGCFLLGIFALWFALASPLDTFSGFLLPAHMLQHMVVMMVAPPLILLGAPLIPLVRGLPVFGAREFAGPFLNWRVATRVGNFLIHPATALILMGAAMFSWHTPRLYELALASSGWHEVEHACFFVASLIFWWPVIQPWPSQAQRARWIVVPYLLIGDLQNTVVAAILVFSDRLVYPSYAVMPRLFGMSALADQSASGAIMWVLGSTVFLIPACVIAVQCLSSRRPAPQTAHHDETSRYDALLGVAEVSLVSRGLRRRFRAPTAEAITFIVFFTVAGLCLAALASRPSDDDDQALRVSQVSGPFAVSVFSLPGDLAAGNAEFSVLVQDRDTLQVVQDAKVELQAERTGTSQSPEAVRASSDDSENKLLQTAEVDLPTPGDWTLGIRVSRNDAYADITLPLRVVKAEAGMTMSWPYVIFGVLVLVLLFSYRRRHRRSNIPLRHAAATASTARNTAKLS